MTDLERAARLDPDELAALEEQRRFLLVSLADLEREHQAGDLDDHDYDALRDDYTARAAEVIRAIDERRAALLERRPPRRLGRAVASGLAVVVLAVGAGVWVAHSAGSRHPGQAVSGDAGSAAGTPGSAPAAGGRSAATACIPKIMADTLGALKCFQTVLAKSPNDPVALTYRGWALTLAAQSATQPSQLQELAAAAEASLIKAVKAAPQMGDPHVFLAILYTNTGRCDQAREQLATIDALKLPPDSQIRQLVDSRLRPQLAGGACPQRG